MITKAPVPIVRFMISSCFNVHLHAPLNKRLTYLLPHFFMYIVLNINTFFPCNFIRISFTKKVICITASVHCKSDMSLCLAQICSSMSLGHDKYWNSFWHLMHKCTFQSYLFGFCCQRNKLQHVADTIFPKILKM